MSTHEYNLVGFFIAFLVIGVPMFFLVQAQMRFDDRIVRTKTMRGVLGDSPEFKEWCRREDRGENP